MEGEKFRIAEPNLSNAEGRGLLFRALRVILFSGNEKRGITACPHTRRGLGGWLFRSTRVFSVCSVSGKPDFWPISLSMAVCCRENFRKNREGAGSSAKVISVRVKAEYFSDINGVF